MKQVFSTDWKASKQPRKQRKYRYNAPLHIRQRFLAAHLSKELREKYKRRNIPVRTGDKVKVLRGGFKGHIGKIEEVDVKRTRVYITGVEITKRDGTKARRALQPSQLLITELSLGDKRRIAGKEA
ncbi:50S ribosomal protein L24 [Candidatus Woesearchaeota archaeon]|nr:50S ribosomal protein L24 [Candidatus Woesearchaeota archaeon]